MSGSQHPEEDASNGERIWRLHRGSLQPGWLAIRFNSIQFKSIKFKLIQTDSNWFKPRTQGRFNSIKFKKLKPTFAFVWSQNGDLVHFHFFVWFCHSDWKLELYFGLILLASDCEAWSLSLLKKLTFALDCEAWSLSLWLLPQTVKIDHFHFFLRLWSLVTFTFTFPQTVKLNHFNFHFCLRLWSLITFTLTFSSDCEAWSL